MANAVIWREHLVCTANGSNKFYEITVESDNNGTYEVLCKYGRRGRDERTPRMQSKGKYADRRRAERKAEEVSRQKKTKGYQVSKKDSSPLDKPSNRKKTAQTTREVSLDRFALLD